MSIVVDPAKFATIRERLSPERFEQVVDAYRTSGQEQVDRLQQAFAQGDLHGLRLAAHTLRSSTALLGAAGVQEAAQEMEEGAERGDWPLPSDIHRLVSLFQQSLADVRLLTEPTDA